MIGLLQRERDRDPKESRHSMVRFAEPLLDTFSVPHARLEGPNDVHLIPEYYRLSRERRGPTAVLPLLRGTDSVKAASRSAAGPVGRLSPGRDRSRRPW
jgi:hypothetical protein